MIYTPATERPRKHHSTTRKHHTADPAQEARGTSHPDSPQPKKTSRRIPIPRSARRDDLRPPQGAEEPRRAARRTAAVAPDLGAPAHSATPPHNADGPPKGEEPRGTAQRRRKTSRWVLIPGT